MIRDLVYRHRNALIFCSLILLVLIDRFVLLEHFTFRFVDDDQSIMWAGAKEYASGNFPEPYFFGQPYNPMFESLFSVPLIFAGVSFPVALTVVTSIVSLVPYFLLAVRLFRRGKPVHACIILSLLLVLPIEFGMVASIPRGFTGGVFFAGFALLQLFSKNKLRYILFGFFSMAGLYANPNAALILFPAAFLFLMENYKSVKFYLQVITGAILPATVWYFSVRFYRLHAVYIVHASWPFQFKTGAITLPSIAEHFNDVIPVFWGMGWMTFLVLLLMSIILFRQRKFNAGVALFGGILLLFFSLAVNKVNDGYPTVFYSWSRMFIGVPLLYALFIAKMDLSRIGSRSSAFLMIIPVCFFVLKCNIVERVVNREVYQVKEHNMYVSDIAELKKTCDTVFSIAAREKVNLVIAGNGYDKHLINYGCPCLRNEFPLTIEPADDRRTWLLKDEEFRVRRNILFVAFHDEMLTEQMKADTSLIRISDHPLLFLLRGNHKATGELLVSLGLPMRQH